MSKDLVDHLVADLTPVDPPRSFAIARLAIIALLVATALAWFILGNRFVDADPTLSSFSWIKLLPFALGVVGFGFLARDISIPGRRPSRAVWVFILAALIGVIGFIVGGWIDDGRTSLLLPFGTKCVRWIVLLSIPGMLLLFGFARRRAVTRPATAGACLGATSGVIGAVVYGMSCSIDRLLFVGVWYVVGIFLVTVLGGVIGARLLRW